jgi:hypothetical protein
MINEENEFEEIEDPLFEDFDEFEDVEEEEIEEETLEVPREDKIFNNRYNTGDGLSEVEDYGYSTKISVENNYSDQYLNDLYNYEDGLESKLILDAIFKYIHDDPELSTMIEEMSGQYSSTKLKFTKEQINMMFSKICEEFDEKSNTLMFYNPIYILEVISSISSIEYKKIFDMLDSDIQEVLILELNKKYHFLEGKMHKKRIH